MNELTKEQQQRLARQAIRRLVAMESDGFFERAQSPADKLRTAGLDRSQVHSLENIAYSTDRLSDIYDFLKKQIGRPGKLGQRWRHRGVGQDLLNALSGLNRKARDIANIVRADYPEAIDDDAGRRIHLELCREYLKHVAAHYQYGETAQ